MVFKRAKARSTLSSIREAFWPSTGWARAYRYMGHRLMRINASSHAIAAGFAAGVAISFTPFLGTHFIGAALISLATRGHVIASAVGTFIGNPWTFPLIFWFTGSLGSLVIGEEVTAGVPPWSWDALFKAPLTYLGELVPLLYPYIVGGIPAAIAAWCISYFAIRNSIDGYRKRQTERRQRGRNKLSENA